MNCEHVEELLSAYLDSMLATTERCDVTTHLNSCPSCLALLNEYRYFDTMIAHLPRYSPSKALSHELLYAVQSTDQPSSHCSSFPEVPHTEEIPIHDSHPLPLAKNVCHLCTVSLPYEHKRHELITPQAEISLELSLLAPDTITTAHPRSLYILTITLLLLLALGISLLGWQFWSEQNLNQKSNTGHFSSVLEQRQELQF